MAEVGISPELMKFFDVEYDRYYDYLKETILVYERVIGCKSKGLPYNLEDLRFFPSVNYLESETMESLEYTKSSFSLMIECYERVGSFEIAPEKYIGEKRLIVEGLRKRQEDMYKKFKGLV